MGKLKVKCGYCSNIIHRRKAKTNTYFCDIICKGKWQILQREKQGYTKEWLVNQYFNLGKDCNKIAKEIGKDGKTVWNWFNGYGVELNKRGYSYKDNLCLDGSSWKGRKHKETTKNKIRQARIKDGHVPYLKNGEHWLKSVPKEKHPTWKGGLTPERQKVYSSIEWCESVKKVWERDNAICQMCGKHHNTTNNRGTFHIHHIISFQNRKFRTDVDNLILLCKECHLWVHSKENIKRELIKK